MLWMPLSMICDEENPAVKSKFANDQRFADKREEYFEFGKTEFMELERLKSNFPPGEDGK